MVACLTQKFAEAAVTAYECGYDEDILRQEIAQATEQPGTSESLKVSAMRIAPL